MSFTAKDIKRAQRAADLSAGFSEVLSRARVSRLTDRDSFDKDVHEKAQILYDDAYDKGRKWTRESNVAWADKITADTYVARYPLYLLVSPHSPLQSKSAHKIYCFVKAAGAVNESDKNLKIMRSLCMKVKDKLQSDGTKKA